MSPTGYLFTSLGYTVSTTLPGFTWVARTSAAWAPMYPVTSPHEPTLINRLDIVLFWPFQPFLLCAGRHCEQVNEIPSDSLREHQLEHPGLTSVRYMREIYGVLAP